MFSALGILLTLCLLFFSLEHFLPQRKKIKKNPDRIFSNINLFVLSVPFTFLIQIVTFHYLSNFFSSLPKVDLSLLHPTLLFLLTCIILEGANYYYHVWSHKNMLLWKLHAVHHSDKDLDIFTYLRHHPLETILSTIYLSLVISLLSLPPSYALLYFFINNLFQMFQHTNMKIPKCMNWLHSTLVTPNVHLNHHLHIKEYYNTNYGTVVTLFDKIHRTYSTPSKGVNFGIDDRSYVGERIDILLSMPFKK